jgi:ATP-binding cassette, subfamily C, bacterial CydC
MNPIWRLLRWNPPDEVAPESWPTGVRGLTLALRPYWGLFSMSALSALVQHSASLAAGVLAASIVGAAVDGAAWAELRPYAWWLLGVVLLRATFAFIESWLAHDLAFRLLAVLRHWIYWGIERIAPGGLVRRRSGDLTATAMQDAERLELFYAHMLIEVIIAVAIPVAGLILLATLYGPLALALLPFLVLMATVPLWLIGYANRQGREVRARAGELQAEVLDSVHGLREVLLFGRQHEWLDRLDRYGRSLTRAQLRFGVRGGLEIAVTNTLAALGILAVLLVTANAVEGGALAPRLAPVGVTAAAFTVAALIRFVTLVGVNQGQVFGSADRIFAILNAERPVADRGTRAEIPPPAVAVAFENATFRYQPELPPAIEELGFEIPAGRTVAVVGPSGAGKTTCAYLLMRFWDVEGGRVTIDGVDIRELSTETLRNLIGYVPQDPFLFHASVADNIRIAKPDASDDEVRAAARAARADGFIERMPEGYDSMVGERGARLSGGERQRIAIARALLKNPPILVMDEPTSMLDAFSERELREAMERARAGRTVLVIAHRLSTIRTADRIVVLDGGRVAETGTHDELVERGGLYARLVSIQQEGILAG